MCPGVAAHPVGSREGPDPEAPSSHHPGLAEFPRGPGLGLEGRGRQPAVGTAPESSTASPALTRGPSPALSHPPAMETPDLQQKKTLARSAFHPVTPVNPCEGRRPQSLCTDREAKAQRGQLLARVTPSCQTQGSPWLRPAPLVQAQPGNLVRGLVAIRALPIPLPCSSRGSGSSLAWRAAHMDGQTGHF